MDFVPNVLNTLQPRDGVYMMIVKLDLGKDMYVPIRVPDNEWENMGLEKSRRITAWFRELGKSPIIHDLDKEDFYRFADVEKMKRCFLRGKKYRTFVHRRIKSGEYVLAVSVLEPGTNYSPENQEAYLYVIDIEHIYFRAYVDVIKRLGEKDYKTGTYSRSAFDMELIKLSRMNSTIGVIYIEINGLRYVNENYGRMTGDKLLKQFSAWLAATFPYPYKVYRLCGEDFIVILEKYNQSLDYTVKEAKDFLWQERPLASVGYAVGRGVEVNLLIDKAESEMYKERKSKLQSIVAK